MLGRKRVEVILADLHSPSERVREKAFENLKSRIKRSRLNEGEVCAVLAAAPGPWPYSIDTRDGAEAILSCFYSASLGPNGARTLAELYPGFPPKARLTVMRVLGSSGDTSALNAYMDVVRRHARSGAVTELAGYATDCSQPHVAAALFPELLNYLDVDVLVSEICHMAFDALRKGAMRPATLEPFTHEFIRVLKSLREIMEPLQQSTGRRWMYEEAYEPHRNLAGLLLDLAAYLPAAAAVPELRAWQSIKDPRPLVFSTLSLARFVEPIDPQVAYRCAQHPELRLAFFERLQDLGLTHAYPDEFYSQLHFAEADMVRWLSFPTELGTVPDEIVAAKILRFRTEENRPVALYVFRFRVDEPHWSAADGWMAGVSGPFPLDGSPCINDMGGTFSDFKSWESRSAVEHAKAIAAITIGELPEFEVLEPGEEYK